MKNFSVKRLLITILFVFLTAGATGGSIWYIMDGVAKNDQEALNLQITELEKRVESLLSGDDKNINSDVMISTDKSEYAQNEVIKITVKNHLDDNIYYYEIDTFWGLEIFQNDSWIKVEDYQVFPDMGLGNKCDLVLYERPEPTELESNKALNTEWNQLICPIVGSPGPPQPSIIRRLDSGKYRLTFSYGQKISDGELKEIIGDTKSVYSDSFIIK